MTYRYSIFLILATISGDTAPLGAHVGDRLYPISYLSEETLAALDQDDAIVEDWVEVVGEPVLTPLDLTWRLMAPTTDSTPPTSISASGWGGVGREESMSPPSLPTTCTSTNTASAPVTSLP